MTCAMRIVLFGPYPRTLSLQLRFGGETIAPSINSKFGPIIFPKLSIITDGLGSVDMAKTLLEHGITEPS